MWANHRYRPNEGLVSSMKVGDRESFLEETAFDMGLKSRIEKLIFNDKKRKDTSKRFLKEHIILRERMRRGFWQKQEGLPSPTPILSTTNGKL